MAFLLSTQVIYQEKVAQARATLTRAYDYVDNFQLEMERLLDTEVTNEKFEEIMTDVMPLPAPTSENVSVITRINNNKATIEKLFNEPV